MADEGSMIERVTRVLADHAGDGRDYTEVAVAVIEEMRSPPEAFLLPIAHAHGMSEPRLLDVFNHIIDAALSEEANHEPGKHD